MVLLETLDGTIIRGSVVLSVPGGQTIIQSADENKRYTLRHSDIKRIMKWDAPAPRPKAPNPWPQW